MRYLLHICIRCTWKIATDIQWRYSIKGVFCTWVLEFSDKVTWMWALIRSPSGWWKKKLKWFIIRGFSYEETLSLWTIFIGKMIHIILTTGFMGGGFFCRNLLSIDSRLNQIDPSTNIFPPNPERGYRTKFEILLEEVFPNSIVRA